MNSSLRNFSFQYHSVRIVEKDGEPWFVAKDVALALGYEWAGIRNVQHIPEEWRGVESVSTPSGNQEMHIISEQGLYFFLGRSDKPFALPFQKWIAGEVIPSIRKKGFYAVPGNDREEQDEWKKNFPYPFLLLEDAAAKMRELRLAIDKGLATPAEWRNVVLGNFGPRKPDTSIIKFVQANLAITGNPADFVPVAEVFARYEERAEIGYSRNILLRKIKAAFPGLTYKQKKIDGYPVLVFIGCRLQFTKAIGGDVV